MVRVGHPIEAREAAGWSEVNDVDIIVDEDAKLWSLSDTDMSFGA